jgi:hypothetical protein
MIKDLLKEREYEELETSLKGIILKYHKGVKLESIPSFRTMWILDDSGIEFRYSFLADKIIISRVSFTNKNRGCMTECLEKIKSFARANGFSEIIIQSVLTKEMETFCMRKGFKPDVNCMKIDDILTGDYHLIII